MNSVYFVFGDCSSALRLVKPFLGLVRESDTINSVSLVIWLWAQFVNAISMWLKLCKVAQVHLNAQFP